MLLFGGVDISSVCSGYFFVWVRVHFFQIGRLGIALKAIGTLGSLSWWEDDSRRQLLRLHFMSCFVVFFVPLVRPVTVAFAVAVADILFYRFCCLYSVAKKNVLRLWSASSSSLFFLPFYFPFTKILVSWGFNDVFCSSLVRDFFCLALRTVFSFPCATFGVARFVSHSTKANQKTKWCVRTKCECACVRCRQEKDECGSKMFSFNSLSLSLSSLSSRSRPLLFSLVTFRVFKTNACMANSL